jgi:hypothetical protein
VNRLKQLLSSAVLSILFAAAIQSGYGQPAGTKHVIFDPVVNMNAFSITVPSNWTFEGTVYPGTQCDMDPITVYRTASPDGLSGVYLLPRIDWSWLTGPGASKAGVAAGCLPYHDIIKAHDFATYMVGKMQVGFVKDLTDPAEEADMKRHDAEMNAQARGRMTWWNDTARFLVRYELNRQEIEEVLGVGIICSDSPGISHLHKCSAFVKRAWAPLGKGQSEAGLFKMIDTSGSIDLAWNAQWQRLIGMIIRNQIADIYRGQADLLLQQGEMAHNALMQQHREFMGSMQRGADVRQYQFVVGQYNKRKITEDYVDYSLDCHRLRGGYVGNCPNRQTAP